MNRINKNAYSRINKNRNIKTSRRTGKTLKENVNFNNYKGGKHIRSGNGEMIDGFRIKENHVAMFDDDGMLIKVATSIVNKPNKSFIIVFVRGKYEWLKNNYSIDKFIDDFGKEYLSILSGAKDIYAKDSRSKKIHDDMINQIDFVSDHLYEIYTGRTEEITYMIEVIDRYNKEVCVRIKIPDSIRSWDSCKYFDLENDRVEGGLTLYEDIEIELQYLKGKGVKDYLKYREKIDDLAYNNYMQEMLTFIGYIKSNKWK